MDLTTLARIKTRLDITGAGEDALISQLITDVSGRVETFLDRQVLVEAAKVEFIDIHASEVDQIISLAAYPITALTTIHYDTEQVYGTDTLLVAADYRLLRNGDTGQVMMKIRMVEAPGALKVTYAGGMAANAAAFITAFPAITAAVDQQVAFEKQRSRQVGVSSLSGSAGSVTTFESGQFLQSVRRTLAQWRRIA